MTEENLDLPAFEAAKRCPKCGEPGEDMGASPTAKPGVKVHTIFCRKEGCEWVNTNWLVQVNKDGTIPKPYEQIGDKQFPKLSAETETRIQEAIERQLQAETQPGTEIINPFG